MPRTHPERTERPTTPSRRDAIGEWLDVFVKLLRLPDRQSEQIRDELEDHLRSRVDDLMIGGMDESEATRRAVEELGTTVELARRFRLAETHPRRRLIMQLLTCAIVGGAVALGVTTLQPSGPGSPATPPVAAAPSDAEHSPDESAPRAEVTPGEPSSLRDPRQDAREALADVRMATGADWTWEFLFYGLAGQSEMEAVVRWGPLGEFLLISEDEVRSVIAPDRAIGTNFPEGPADQLIDRLNEHVEHVILKHLRETERLSTPVRPLDIDIDVRVRNGTLIFSTKRDFDAEEMKVVVYDLTDLTRAAEREAGMPIQQTMDSVLEVLKTFVEPSMWPVSAEGDSRLAARRATALSRNARIHGRAFGTRLIIEAPQRVHPQIETMLMRLVDTEAHLHIPVGPEEARKPEMSTSLYVLNHASADDVARSVNRSLDEQGFGELARVVPDMDSGSVIAHVAANRSDISLMLVRMIESSIDRKASEAEGASSRR